MRIDAARRALPYAEVVAVGRTFPLTRRGFLKSAASAGVVSTLGVTPAFGATNPIVAENQRPGTDGSGFARTYPSIAGFATESSVNRGETVRFKVATDSSRYRIDVYRIGWYGGAGARLVTTIRPSVPLPQAQPAPVSDPATGLNDFGTWAESASWAVPADAVSGVYFAHLIREDAAGLGDESQIGFVVRDDGRASDLLFQTADTTQQAYNIWGGNSLYMGTTAVGRAFKVSYNRPLLTASAEKEFWNAEYPMVRWLERNGYDVSYCTAADVARRPAELLRRKAFLSVGHDEYWAGEQRTAVEAARAAGVHLAFFSGNEVFWKTRWEPDAAGRPYRTLVCYKETKPGAKIDPSPEWTGTWRDARLSPPSDGGRPENALIGQLFTAVDDPAGPGRSIRVPQRFGRLRQWRGTSVATLPEGEEAVLPIGMLGHEWGEDLDNGARPPGVIRLSSTTEEVLERITDEGNVFTPGLTTHSLTLYRHGNGALVFGAGTIQFSWGLDNRHMRGEEPADPRVQQFVLNVFADMGVQPATRQAGLVAATASTDRTPPTATVTDPAEGAADVRAGMPFTVRGTAADAGGGVVAAVEVSVDGATWHPADGTEAWTWTWVPDAPGAVTLRVRAVDDSGNIQDPPTSRAVTVGRRAMPCTIFDAAAVPALVDSGEGGALELGLRFRVDADGFVNGVRFYKAAGNTGPHVGRLWTAGGQLLASAPFAAESPQGWQEVDFPSQVPVTAGTTYVASYSTTTGHYSVDPRAFLGAGAGAWPVRALSSEDAGGNGVYLYGGSGFPTGTYQGGNYWVDVVFDDTDRKAPRLVARSPEDTAVGVSRETDVVLTFNEPVQAAATVVTLRGPDGAEVPATLTVDEATRTARLVPAALLAPSALHTVELSATRDAAGNALEAPVSWTFTTRGANDRSLWPSTAAPVLPAADAGAVELGVRFTADTDGRVTALRFYRGAGNDGGHVGSLWTLDGTLLAQATFAAETERGWQQAALDPPVAVRRGTEYIASYHAPAGHYAADGGFFSSAAHDAPPLHAPEAGWRGNGRYRYGATPGFPDQFSAANYWVDVLFDGRDVAGPGVLASAPANGEVGVTPDTTVRVEFDEPVDPATVVLELSGPLGAVAGTLTYDAASRTAVLTPSGPLRPGAGHTARLRAATDLSGNPLPAERTWTFTTRTAAERTLWPSTAVPAVPAADDGANVELGVRFTSDVAGRATGVRFYKGAGNDGTHVGSLWALDGTLLAQATFAAETVGGWQQVRFAAPVAVTPGTEYVASYRAPQGRYAADAGVLGAGHDAAPLHAPPSGGSGNGRYRYGGGYPDGWSSANYWVDVVFEEGA